MSGEEENAEEVSAPTPQMMRSNIPLPQKLITKKNIHDNWKAWKQVWDSYEIVSNLASLDDKYRVATFITCIGSEGLEIYNGLPFETEADKNSMEKILELMEAHCIGAVNVTYERYKFNNRDQLQSEGIDTYVANLRTIAQTCKFGALKEDLIRDRIICGIRENGLRKRLLQERELSLKKCIDMCRASETTSVQTKAMNSAQTEEVHKVGKTPSRSKSKNPTGQTDKKSCDSSEFPECYFCGRRHERSKNKCPAYGKKCSKCGKENHFAVKCKTAKSQKNNKVHKVENESDDEYCFTVTAGNENQRELKINTLDDKKQPQSKIYANLIIENKSVKFQVDSGATCNIIPKENLPQNCRIEPTTQQLNLYNGSSMQPCGKAVVQVTNPRNTKKYRVEFVVVEGNFTPLLGARIIQRMNLIKVRYENIASVDGQGVQQLTKEDVFKNYADVFEGEGTLPGKLHLEIDKTIPPVKQPIRRVPLAMKAQLKEELQRLQDLGITKPVEEPTEWVSSLVVMKKANGKLRICIDPKPLNKALKRSHYPMPVIDDILPELSQAKVFSVCDVKNGFWHVELDESSSYLTTFGTPFGRFRWLRMPFGISPAPEYFQQRLDQVIANLPGVRTIADDIIVCGVGANIEDALVDHDRNIVGLLQRCQEKGVKVNKEKFRFKQTEIPYMGHVLTQQGVKPDPEKVEAIVKMERPVDVKGVQRLVGVVNYLAKFLPKLADICKPLRDLTRKEREWNWSHEHDQAFTQLKEAVSTAPVLKYFNPEQEVTLQCDASQSGLGAVLMQEGQPVAYASRALTNTEQNYAQIEKELLAIVFGMERFHQYTYGRKVHVESDHKPLETINTKPLISAPKRLQRMLLRLQRYDITIKYKPGKDMHLADTLSRAYLRKTQDSVAEEQTIMQVKKRRSETETAVERINMLDYIPLRKERLAEIQKATEEDSTMQMLKKTIKDGWPENIKKIPRQITPYFGSRDELTEQDGIIFKGNRCVIPISLREDILQRIHRSHIGIQGCLKRARESVYWPGITKHIKDHIAKCEVCRAYEVKQQKETLQPHEIPDRPWSRIAADLLDFDGKEYLVTVDYYSNFWEVDYLTKTTSTQVIKKMKQHFARYGIPDTLVSDNGTQFSSEEFKQFANEWEFEHITSSPGYPQSNGMAESAVKSAKKILRKAKQAGTDPLLAILAHRNTPSPGLDSSPAQRLMCRRTKTLLPTHAKLLKPKLEDHVREKIEINRQKQARNYNKTAKDLQPLNEGDTVRIQPLKNKKQPWLKATVKNELENRSYEVLTEKGSLLRRNRKHLRRTQEDKVVEQIPTEIPVQEEVQPQEVLQPLPSSQTTRNSSSGQQTRQAVVTRAGRVVKPPSYLKDYVQ